MNQKLIDAMEILRQCRGTRGIYAAPVRYRYHLWTRDLGYALAEAMRHTPGGPALVNRHLVELARRRLPRFNTETRKDGTHTGGAKFPILFLDGAAGHLHLIREKVALSMRTGKMSFTLKRYLQGKLHNLTPGTRDSELMYAHALLAARPGVKLEGLEPEEKAALDDAMTYIELHLMDSFWPQEKSLILGADWRDTMDEELKDKALLSNNALLFGVFKRLGWEDRAHRIFAQIWSRKDENGIPLDYDGATRPDPHGLALGVLEGLLPAEDYWPVLRGFQKVDSPTGVTIECMHSPYGVTAAEIAREAEVIQRTRGVVTWPFVVGKVILACLHIAQHSTGSMRTHALEMAYDQMAKLDRIPGHPEWIDPQTGNPHGAPQQGWSAAMYFLAARALGRIPAQISSP